MHDMNELINFLYLGVTGLVISGILMLFLGHRVKKSHWFFSLAYLAGIIFASAGLLERYFDITASDNVLLVYALTGALIIALSEKWNALGQVAFTFAFFAASVFVIYAGYVTFYSGLGPLSLSFSIILLLLIAASMSLMMVHTFEMLDVICRVDWQRTMIPQETTDYFPKVSLHVPAYNEPPEMVIETLNALAAIDYPNYEVLMVDNNTTDESLWKPVEAHCKKLGFKFIHLENWPGFKSGALNYANTQVAPDTEIIGIIDSDYVVEPEYLKEMVGFFKNENMAFVQTPQDYRDFEDRDRFATACYHAYQYFFKLSMMTRNERNGIIFTGTMGLIRRSILEKVGGWDEWCITEDAEIALKILNMGYESLYIDKTYGRGLMPLNFEGLKKQRFRWAFGGMQVLRLHWKKLLPFSGVINPENKLSFGQKFDFWSGGLQWLNDPLAFIFTIILLIASTAYGLTNSVFLQPMAGASLYIPFVFIIFGLLKIIWALRIRLQCSILQAYRAFMTLLSLTWVVALACLLGLFKKEGVFLRTPKQQGNHSRLRSYLIVYKEFMISLLCLIAAVVLFETDRDSTTVMVLSGLLLWQSYLYGSSVIVNHWSNLSQLMLHEDYQGATSKSTGLRFRAMITDRRAVLIVMFLSASLVTYYYIAITFAPEKEIAYRANPYNQALLPHKLVNPAPETQLKAKIFVEEDAAVGMDIEVMLNNWDENGIIRDANYTLNDTSDDRVWQGIDQIRRRYEEEFSLRTYHKLEHRNISVKIKNDSAVIINDLFADIESNGKRQQVYIEKGDRWELKRVDGEWKITSLMFNRTAKK